MKRFIIRQIMTLILLCLFINTKNIIIFYILEGWVITLLLASIIIFTISITVFKIKPEANPNIMNKFRFSYTSPIIRIIIGIMFLLIFYHYKYPILGFLILLGEVLKSITYKILEKPYINYKTGYFNITFKDPVNNKKEIKCH